ncbi:MAG: HNH endonuclease [Flavobacteriales bacterium]|nr:HNH endonuclease [Flavobacteriales bacterium]
MDLLREDAVALEDTADLGSISFPEGQVKYYVHRQAERNTEVVRIAKERFLLADPLACCQVCSFSYVQKYGDLGIGYIEAHHTIPVSEMKPGHETKPEDLVMVCSNCHVMLHRRRPWLNHESDRHCRRSQWEHVRLV